MKLAVIDLLFRWPPDGGARTDVKEIAQRLARDHEVTVFVPRMDCGFARGAGVERLPFRVVAIPTTPLAFNPVHFGRALRQELDRFRPDLLFFTDGWYLKPLLIDRFADYPYVVRFYAYEGLCLRAHGTLFRGGKLCRRDFPGGGLDSWLACVGCAGEWLFETRARVFAQEFLAALPWLPWYQTITARVLRRAAGLICYHRFIAGKLAPYNQRIHLIPSGIDPGQFTPRAEPRRLDPAGPIELLMVGRASDPAKGYAVLRRAFQILACKYPGLRLTVTSDFQFREELPGVTIVPWRDPDQLAALYAAADIAVVPSIWPEPFGIVALEAMAAGVPVVASRVGGLQDVFVEGEEGLLYDGSSAAELANTIEQLIVSPGRARELAVQARRRVERDYPWDVVARRVGAVLVAAAGEPASRAARE